MSRAWGIRGAAAALLFLAGCGSLPHPFEHEGPNSLLDDQTAMQSVRVLPVEALPGLDKDVIKALNDEDIAASGSEEAPLTLTAKAEGDDLVWRLADTTGNVVTEWHQLYVAKAADALRRKRMAREVADTFSRRIRGADSGLADIESRPRVLVRPVKAPAPIDGASLARTMARALAQHDVTVAEDNVTAIVEGSLRIRPGSGAVDTLDVSWRVLDAKGREIAVISQSGPIGHVDLSGSLGQTGRDIASAGAGAVAEVVHKNNKTQ